MSRKRSRKNRHEKSYNAPVQRDRVRISEPKRRLLHRPSYFRDAERTIVNDRRRYRPDRHDSLRYDDGRYTEVKTSQETLHGTRYKRLGNRLEFVNPDRIDLCRRRRDRRESLFAKGKIGSGKKVTKNRRYTQESRIKC